MDPSAQISVSFAAFIAVLVGVTAIPWEVFTRIDPPRLAEVRGGINAIRDELSEPIAAPPATAPLRDRIRTARGRPARSVVECAISLRSQLDVLERERDAIVTKIQRRTAISALLFSLMGILATPLAWWVSVLLALSAAATFFLASLCSVFALLMSFRWLAGIGERRLAAEDDDLVRPVVWLFPVIAAASLLPFFGVAVPQLSL